MTYIKIVYLIYTTDWVVIKIAQNRAQPSTTTCNKSQDLPAMPISTYLFRKRHCTYN